VVAAFFLKIHTMILAEVGIVLHNVLRECVVDGK
jgi:hypothetical protein